VLHAAALRGNREVIDFLIEKGAKIEATDNNGKRVRREIV
jgi:ankyrin repeat protein